MKALTLPKAPVVPVDVLDFISGNGHEAIERPEQYCEIYEAKNDADVQIQVPFKQSIWKMRLRDGDYMSAHLVYRNHSQLFSEYPHHIDTLAKLSALTERYSQAFAERGKSASSSDLDRVNELVLHDAEQIWTDLQCSLVDEDFSARAQWQFEGFLKRHGSDGIKAISALLLGRLPSGEISWSLLRMLGEARDESTLVVRRDVIAASLESRDAGLRYAAAASLGNFEKGFANAALERRLRWEKNPSVRRMIQAELRR